MKLTKYILTLLIINYTLLITNCFSQQWRVFTTSNSPLPSNGVSSIIIDRNNIKWLSTLRGLVRIENNSWQIYNTTNSPLLTDTVDVESVDSLGNIWLSQYNQGIAKFNGINWTFYNTSNSGLPTNSITCIAIDYQNVKWIGPPLAKFDDFSWIIYNSTNSGLPHNLVTTVAIDGHLKWIGTFSLTGGMAKYNDTNWTIYNTGNSGIPSNTIRKIRIDSIGDLWICTYAGGLAKFNSILNMWTVYNTGNSGIGTNDLFTIDFRNNVKFVGTEGAGLKIYNDTSWQTFNTSNSPMPHNTIFDVRVDKNNNVWIATSGGLAIYNPVNIMGIDNEIITPKIFVLHQNHPNPFNPKTNIRYKLSHLSDVVLKIYDITGREIAVLVNEEQKHGDYEVNWNASNYTSGVYFCTLLADGFSESKKMILLK